ncbi:Bacteriophage replication protein [Pseudomonas sp. JV551A1]|nr:Bacteriophage replication protein [Pseudomonas sp. JV551A1]
MSPTSYQAAPSRVRGRILQLGDWLSSFLNFRLAMHIFRGKEKGHCVYSGLFLNLVAGAGFEPTTFGL